MNQRITACEIVKNVKEKKTSALEVVQSYLKRIEQVEPFLNSFLYIDPEDVKLQAKQVDEKIAKGIDPGPLSGLPVGIKDNIITADIPTTAGSKILQGYIPTYDSTVVKKLRNAGAIILGKLNLDEFAMGSSNENSAYKVVKNPWDLKRVPGGSSGGSAASVAANLCPVALGSDTGGSIRQPASLCGVVGLKPTYGRVSRYGLIAFASSLDQIGTLSARVADSALVLNTISGSDEYDSTTIPIPVPDYLNSINNMPKKVRIGIPEEYFPQGLDSEVRNAAESSVKVFEESGCQIEMVSLPHTQYAIATYYLVANAEASSNLAKFDGIKYGLRESGDSVLQKMYISTRSKGFGPEVKRRIMLGTYALSAGYYDAFYLKALKVRTLIREDFNKVFNKVDIIITPTSPTTAFKIGEKVEDPLAMYLSDIFTVPASLAGLPSISIPCGFDKNRLPIGLHMIASPLKEEFLLQVAHWYETSTPWKTYHPEI